MLLFCSLNSQLECQIGYSPPVDATRGAPKTRPLKSKVASQRTRAPAQRQEVEEERCHNRITIHIHPSLHPSVRAFGIGLYRYFYPSQTDLSPPFSLPICHILVSLQFSPSSFTSILLRNYPFLSSVLRRPTLQAPVFRGPWR